jgi:hypothetical protein
MSAFLMAHCRSSLCQCILKDGKLGKVLSQYFPSYDEEVKNSCQVYCALDEGLTGENRVMTACSFSDFKN